MGNKNMQEIEGKFLRMEVDISVLEYDRTAKPMIFDSKRIHSFRNGKDLDIERAANVFVIANAMELDEIAGFIRQANESKKLRAILIRQDTHQNWITQLLAKADLRTLRNMIVHSGRDVPRRVLTAWQYGAQAQLIADAAVFDNMLYVLNCALKRYEISFDSIKALARIPKKDRDNFIISEEGSHISWPKHDVDINLDSIRLIVDPVAARQAQLRKLTHDRCFGSAVAKLRKEKGLLQNQISGLTDRQVRRIEAGEHATLKSLEILAKAHKMTLNHYLKAVASQI
jgi:hypothetical protein